MAVSKLRSGLVAEAAEAAVVARAVTVAVKAGRDRYG
jgi:hypothetical protein